MITAAQLREAARLVDVGHCTDMFNWHTENHDFYCPVGACAMVLKRDDLLIVENDELSVFQEHISTENYDSTKDAAVMFLLICAEARKHGDL